MPNPSQLPESQAAVVATLKRYDRWCLVIGLLLSAVGYLVSPGSVAFWLFILGGLFLAASSYLALVWYVKRERESREK